MEEPSAAGGAWGRPRQEGARLATHHEAIFDGAPDAMLTVTEDGTIRSANRAVVDLFGYEPAELLGSKIEMLVPYRIRGVHPGLRKSFLDGGVNRRMGAISQRAALRAVRKMAAKYRWTSAWPSFIWTASGWYWRPYGT